MRQYETIFVADPVLPEDELAAFKQSFAAAITEHRGQVLREEDWGCKKLAYEVRKRREGHFIRFEYTCEDAQLPSELERRLRISEPIIKFMTVRIDNDKKRLAWEKTQAERAARKAPGPAPVVPAGAESPGTGSKVDEPAPAKTSPDGAPEAAAGEV